MGGCGTGAAVGAVGGVAGGAGGGGGRGLAGGRAGAAIEYDVVLAVRRRGGGEKQKGVGDVVLALR